MNQLVFLDAMAGELEKILSGIKTMLIQDLSTAQSVAQPVSPGDYLFFLRDNGECDLRVTARVVRTTPVTNDRGDVLSQILKEMQPQLQLTEDQYNRWSARERVLLVEFEAAHKIDVIHVSIDKIMNCTDWIPFEEFSLITQAMSK